jgi:hypothetical protein
VAAQSHAHAFEAIRDQLKAIDQFLRDEDSSDRKLTDSQIAILANQMQQREKEAKEYELQRDLTLREQVYLADKAAATTELLAVLDEVLSSQRVELGLISDECDSATHHQSQLRSARHFRSTVSELLQKALEKLQADQKTGDDSAVVHELFQQAMGLVDQQAAIQVDPVTSVPSTSSSVPDVGPLVSELATIAVTLASQPDGGSAMQHEVTVCAVSRAQAMLSITDTQAEMMNVTETAREWRDRADYKRRQLLAAVEVQANKDRVVDAIKQEITEIANAFQLRRNSRLRQLCEIVSVRTAVAKEKEEVILPVLPGPSQHASATLPAIFDSDLNCTIPLHSSPIPPKAVLKEGRKCTGPKLGLDGRVPLGDEWAKLAAEDDCDPVRVVDVNTLS